jgi:hypothetical protein
MLFFIPQIIKSLGNSSNMNLGWLTMIPYVCGGIAMVPRSPGCGLGASGRARRDPRRQREV